MVVQLTSVLEPSYSEDFFLKRQRADYSKMWFEISDKSESWASE